MKFSMLHGQGGPLGWSLLLHAMLLSLFLIGLGGPRTPKVPAHVEIVQARIVEDLRTQPGKGRLPQDEPGATAGRALESGRIETNHAEGGAARDSVPLDPQRKARTEREHALQERGQRRQLEPGREAEQAEETEREAAARRAAEQLTAARKAAAEAEARVRAEAEAREAKLRAEAQAQAQAKAEADAKRKAELAAKAAAEQSARNRAENEAKARAEKEARARAEAEKAARAKAEAEAKARAEKEAQAKAEKEARDKAEAKRKAEQERLAQAEREQALREQLEAEQEESTLRLQIEDAARRWLGSHIEPRVEGRWLRPSSAQTGMTCIIAIRATSAGTVIAATVTKSSGDEAFDRSAEAAVRKASPLPMPPDPKVAEQFLSFSLRFKP